MNRSTDGHIRSTRRGARPHTPSRQCGTVRISKPARPNTEQTTQYIAYKKGSGMYDGGLNLLLLLFLALYVQVLIFTSNFPSPRSPFTLSPPFVALGGRRAFHLVGWWSPSDLRFVAIPPSMWSSAAWRAQSSFYSKSLCSFGQTEPTALRNEGLGRNGEVLRNCSLRPEGFLHERANEEENSQARSTCLRGSNRSRRRPSQRQGMESKILGGVGKDLLLFLKTCA